MEGATMKRIALLIALLAAPLHADESLVCDVFGDELNCQVHLDKIDDIFDDHNGEKDVEVGTEVWIDTQTNAAPNLSLIHI